MKTVVQKVDRKHIKPEDFMQAAEIIRSGGLVAFPTETVYGLGGNALDATASERIYAAKGRPSDNPLIVHIAELQALNKLVLDIPSDCFKLAEVFWPGPLTMILKKSSIVPSATTGGLDTVAVRMPSDPVASAFIRAAGIYIAAPSANVSGRPSTTKAEHVIEDLDGKIELIIDGGSSVIGLESTIIDLSGMTPVILRPGSITLEQIKAVVGSVRYDKALLRHNKEEEMTARAPGMKYKHYAPKGDLTILNGDNNIVVKAINQKVKEKLSEGKRAGILATEENVSLYPLGFVKSIGKRKDECGIAAHLFEILRDFDAAGMDFIYSESFQDNGLGQAIMNRLLKAAGYQIIQANQVLGIENRTEKAEEL